MNQTTFDIMARFNIDATSALVVHNRMDADCMVDYSECTQREYTEAMDEAFHLEFGEAIIFQQVNA
jgi:hypothetical protein